jgi:hypothetical protein
MGKGERRGQIRKRNRLKMITDKNIYGNVMIILMYNSIYTNKKGKKNFY